MAGLFNHPKMPLVAGGLTVILLGGGIYLSLQDDHSDAGAQPVVAQATQAKPAVSTPVPTLVSSPANEQAEPPVQTATPASATTATPVASPVVAITPSGVAPVQAAQEPVKPAEVKPAAPASPVPVKAAPAAAAPSHETPDFILQIRQQQMAAAAKVRGAQAATTPAVQAPAPIAKVAPHVAAVAKPKPHVVARAVVKPSPVVEDAAPRAVAKTSEAPVAKKEVLPQETEPKANKNNDYTEIKVTAPNQNLSSAKAAASYSGKPSLVTTSGGKAWVRVSPTRTVVVKAGEEIPEMGKVISVTESEMVTEKGKLTLNKE